MFLTFCVASVLIYYLLQITDNNKRKKYNYKHEIREPQTFYLAYLCNLCFIFISICVFSLVPYVQNQTMFGTLLMLTVNMYSHPQGNLKHQF